jgi:hypothetical protein
MGCNGFIGWFLSWVRESDVPLGFYFWAAVGAIGAASRFNFFIDRGTDTLRLNHFLIFVGNKATGKSSALDAAAEVLWRANHSCWGWQPGQPIPNLNENHPWHIKFLPEDTNQETLVRVLQPSLVPLSGGSCSPR